MKIYLKAALALLILICFVFFARATDWVAVVSSVQKVGFNFLILLFITGLSAWLGVLGWRYCLPKDIGFVSGGQLFWIRLFGENIAILNPASMIGGEAVKIYMLTNLGVGQRTALHSIILSRAIMIISQIFILLIAGIWFLSLVAHGFSRPDMEWWWLLTVPVLICGGRSLLQSPVCQKYFKILFHRLRLLNHYRKVRLFGQELWQELSKFYRENRRAMLLSFVFSSLHWIVGSMEFYFILLFLGVKTTVANALLVDMGVIVFKTAGGFIPGQIGIEEYGNKVMLAVIGVTGTTIWITASVLRRTRQLCWIVFGLIVYIILKLKKRRSWDLRKVDKI